MAAGVTIVDYGMGNLLSVRRAFEHCRAEVNVATDATAVYDAERLVLPGVGAFADGMHEIRQSGLYDALREYSTLNRPMLGICLGMQMLFSCSEEFGDHQGLGIIPGQVVKIPVVGTDGLPHKIPHVGWSGLLRPEEVGGWNGTILEGLPSGADVYLVHSYAAVPARSADRLAYCHYDGQVITAAVRSGAVYGCQFHPEKSGPVGLQILNRFARL